MSRHKPAHKPIHRTHPEFQARKVLVSLVGCGGSGSQLLTELGRIHVALRGTGHPGGLHVVAYDPDLVTEANRGRQMFAAADVGHFKSTVLIHRVNAFYGVNWSAEPHSADGMLTYPWPAPYGALPAHVLITCTDTPRSRGNLYRMALANKIHPFPRYWLDLGNGADFGQVILGETPGWKWTIEGRGERRKQELPEPPEMIERAKDPRGWHCQNADRLPTTLDLFPDLEQTPVDDTPSCSLAEALTKQNLFVNRHMATWAATLLWNLLYEGRIDYHAVWVNLRSGEAVSRPCEPVRLQPWEQTAPRRREHFRNHPRTHSRPGTLAGESNESNAAIGRGRMARTTRPV